MTEGNKGRVCNRQNDPQGPHIRPGVVRSILNDLWTVGQSHNQTGVGEGI